MAPKKPSRQEYLNQQVAKLPPAQQAAYKQQVAAAAKGGISSAELKDIDAKLNTTLYGVNNTGGTAGFAPWATPTPTTTTPAYDPYAYEKSTREANRRSAFALLEKEFKDNGLDSLIPDIKKFMTEGYSSEEASLLLPTTEAYKTRFAGNEGRKAKGLSVYNPAQYLAAEQTYRDLFGQYNLNELANQNTYNALIGGAVSIDEAKARVDNVFSKIDNAPSELRAQLSNYLGAYGVGDPTKQRSQIALALMQGPDGINQLDTKLRKAYIRTGAATSKVDVAEDNISQLEKQLTTAGLSTEQIGTLSKQAYSAIAEVQPTTEKLSQIYGDQTPGLAKELEQEAFFGLASQRRKKLQEKEKATFGGQAGISTASLAQRTTGAI
jgi:hypothetical protein